jgi:hypothetical protein
MAADCRSRIIGRNPGDDRRPGQHCVAFRDVGQAPTHLVVPRQRLTLDESPTAHDRASDGDGRRIAREENAVMADILFTIVSTNAGAGQRFCLRSRAR